MPSGLVDAALTILVEARRRASEGRIGEAMEADTLRRLNVAITAAHTVIEPPSMPTDELRAMGLWWELDTNATDEPGPVVLSREEAVTLRGYINGDSFDVKHLDSFMAKVGEEP